MQTDREIFRGWLGFLALIQLSLVSLITTQLFYEWAVKGQVKLGTAAAMLIFVLITAGLITTMRSRGWGPTLTRVVSVVLSYLLTAFVVLTFTFGFQIWTGALDRGHLVWMVGFIFIAAALYQQVRRQPGGSLAYRW